MGRPVFLRDSHLSRLECRAAAIRAAIHTTASRAGHLNRGKVGEVRGGQGQVRWVEVAPGWTSRVGCS